MDCNSYDIIINKIIQYKEVNTEMLGKTIKSVHINKSNYEDKILFVFTDNSFAEMQHYQDCCESVDIEDICGDLSDLVGQVLISFEEATNIDKNASESATWTFYKIRTPMCDITIRWYGESNGWYSETAQVDYYKSTEEYVEDYDEDQSLEGFIKYYYES